MYCINATDMKILSRHIFCKLEVIVTKTIIMRILKSYTSIQCGLLQSMHMDSTCYTIMYNDNSVMYHEPRHDLYYTVNTIIIEFNSI